MLRGDVGLVISMWRVHIGRLPWGIESDPRGARHEGGGHWHWLYNDANWRRHAQETERDWHEAKHMESSMNRRPRADERGAEERLCSA